MRVLSIVSDTDDINGSGIGACDAYRSVYPLHMMALAGHQTGVISWNELSRYTAERRDPVWRDFDVIQFQRLAYNEESAYLMREVPLTLRALGKTVLMDYDDDFTNEHRHVHEGSLDGLENYSGVIVSTPYLKRVMQRYAHNVYVIPNAVVPEMFQAGKFRRLNPYPTITLTGSTTHTQDWLVIRTPLLRVLDEFPEAHVFCAGYVPDWLKGHRQLIKLGDYFMFPPGVREDFFVKLGDYGFIMQNTDILLAPVDPTDKFNWSKSNVKALEAQVAARQLSNGQTGGAAVIATGDIPNYRDCITSGSTGLLVNHADEEGWYTAIASLLKNSDSRERLQANGYRHCMKHFTQQARLAERVSVYAQAMRDDLRNQHEVRAEVAAWVEP